MATVATLHFITGLVVVQASLLKILHEESHVVAQDLQTRQRRWLSEATTGDPVWAADKRGHYRDRQQPEESQPELLTEEGQDNSSHIADVDHVYYTSKIHGPGDAAAQELWVDVDEMEGKQWKVLHHLSEAHRQAERVNLSFDFPFYGHLLKEITVATGGFIYTGDILHQMLTATQYIAPLMANFDPSLSQNSAVLYCDNGSALVVQWNHIHLQDNTSLGTFTFQTTLHRDGRIVFAYREIPVDISGISSENHPVKVGLSDAFVVLRKMEHIPNIRRRTIYEYHRVSILKSKISSSTAVEMLPLPTCLQFSSCGPCVTAQIGFNCSWCSRLLRCSSGFDRNRQDWVDFGCPEERRDPRCIQTSDIRNSTSHHLPHASTPAATSKQQRNGSMSPTVVSKTSTIGSPPLHRGNDKNGESDATHPNNTSSRAGSTEGIRGRDEGLSVALLAGIVVLMAVMVAAIFISVYLYNNPTSSMSLFFMERRPTHWPILKFRRGSSRPSYAEVEAPGHDREGFLVIDLKQSFVMSDRRESEQKEGFIVPDQREHFLRPERS